MVLNRQKYLELLIKTSAEGGFPAAKLDNSKFLHFMCYYRLNDRKCAIGILIPDNVYHKDMECGDVYKLIDRFPSLKEHFPKDVAPEEFYNIQQIHDNLAKKCSQQNMKWPHETFVTQIKQILT